MAGRDASEDPKATPDPTVEKGIATVHTLRIGVKAFVEKDSEKRRAEILSIQHRKGQPQYYVHYEEFNKRLDEWVPLSRIDLTKEVEWPQSEAATKKASKTTIAPKNNKITAGQKRPRLSSGLQQELSTGSLTPTTGNQAGQARPSLAGGKENSHLSDSSITVLAQEISIGSPRLEDEDLDLVDVQDAAATAKAGTGTQANYSREEEIENLRTGGSMTQNQTEISRVRNLSKMIMGAYEIEPWYFSPYPVAFTEADVVYICEYCLLYFDQSRTFERHRQKCTLLHPPGNEIYRDDQFSFFEIDGRRQRTWCRNLCLLSKLFLDHKTLFYDVDPFLFYCMTTRDERGHHFIGYFSKEKESAEGYNVACILTLPQYQRKGFSRPLIAFSYELSKRENKLGSPEKPLSDLGLLSYRGYWEETVVSLLLDNPSRREMSVEEIGAATAMTTADLLGTLQNLNMLRYVKGNHVIVLTDAVIERHDKRMEKEKSKGKHRIDPSRLNWKPPVFSAASRTWNW